MAGQANINLNSTESKNSRGVIAGTDFSNLANEESEDRLRAITSLLNTNIDIWNKFSAEQKDSLGDLLKYNVEISEAKLQLEKANFLKQSKLETEKVKKRQEWAKKLDEPLTGIINKTQKWGGDLSNLGGLSGKLFGNLGTDLTSFSSALATGGSSLIVEAVAEVGTIISSAVDKLFNELFQKIDGVIDRFVEAQEENTYALIGTGRKLSDVTDNLQESLALSQLLRQEDVYKNVSDLLREGIVYNVEQRAFLQTMATDIGATFNAKNGFLTRLINLQRQDISSNRLAMERSLKELLNANYENSQYIKNSFESVSNSLLEAQSLMSAQGGIQVESIIQKWLGSMESVGMSSSTVQNLATAIGQLGSGNISALSGSNLGNLIVMGASQAGLSYADLLTRGLTSEDTDNLMRGIVQYIASMASNTSNVVKSEYARLFGINVSDIVAATNLGTSVQAGELNTNINQLLGEFGDYVPSQTKLNNLLENFIYTLGTNVADDKFTYYEYKTGRLISEIADNLSASGGLLGDLAGWGLNKIASAGTFWSLLGPGLKTIGDVINFWGNNQKGGGLIGEFLSLSNSESQKIVSSGLGLSGLAGTTTSASTIIKDTAGLINKTAETQNNLIGTSVMNVNEVDLMRSTMTSAMNRDAEILDIEADSYVSEQDFYQSVNGFIDNLMPLLESQKDFIENDAIPFFNRDAYETYTKIHEVQNTVTIGEVSGATSNYISDMLSITAINTENIYMLLQEYVAKMGVEITNYNNEGSIDWLTSSLTNRYADNKFVAGFNFNYQDMEAGA